MNQANPYAPPTARVADVAVSSYDDSEAAFFPVSVLKLVLMSICTLGLYQVYWFYKNWKYVKQRENSAIMPFWRAIFAVFFCYGLFKRVEDFEHPDLDVARLSATGMAAGWIILTLLWRLPDPYGLISLFAFLFTIPVQQRINQINEVVAPSHDPNSRYSGWNWFGLITGGLLVVLAIIGSFVPEA